MPKPAPADLPPAPALEDSPFVAESRRRFLDFLAALPSGGPIIVLCHSDADGLAAGAILARGLKHTGRRATALATGKIGNAWAEETRRCLLALTPAPAALIVTDLGVRPDPVLGDDVPAFFIDHHRPGGGFMPEVAAADPCIVTGYGVEPTPCSALLALACVEALDPALGAELDWIAALGTLSDLGDRAPFPFLAVAKKRHGATLLRDATSLLNAPRRAASGDASPALALLLRANGPREILSETIPEAAALRVAKAEVAAAYAEAKKGAPKFTRDKRVAAVRMDTPCQVHPLVAQIWRTRFPQTIVMGVNTGFRPGFVHFSARCGKGINLLDFFREHRPAGSGPEPLRQRPRSSRRRRPARRGVERVRPRHRLWG